jgi:hypothetical protein
MKSYRGPDTTITSMAQHASPNWKYHNEYFRDQFRSHDNGFGMLNLSTTPT